MIRTQIEFITHAKLKRLVYLDGTHEQVVRPTPESKKHVLWLDVEEGAVSVGDCIRVAELPDTLTAYQICVSLRESSIFAPHSLGTLVHRSE